MENSINGIQSDTDTLDATAEQVRSFINYEAALGKFFKELNLKANQCQLIRAFVLVSKGKKEFEASFAELGSVFNKKNENQCRPDSTARNAFKGLMKWQEEHKMELVRVLRKGQRTDNNGMFTYIKTKYEFVILDELVAVLYSNSENLDSVIERTLIKIRQQYKPVAKAKSYHPNHSFRKAKKTIFTKIEVLFDLAIAAKTDPVSRCQKVLTECQEVLDRREGAWIQTQNREKFKEEFESLMSMNQEAKEQESVTN